MNAKIFSYKVEGVILENQDAQLKVSKSFDRKAILEPLKETFAIDNYKIDEASLSFKVIDDQLLSRDLLLKMKNRKALDSGSDSLRERKEKH